MGLFTLVANTVAQIVFKEQLPREVRVSSDSTTITRIARTEEELSSPSAGEILTAYESKVYAIPPDGELYAISTGVPNISVTRR